MQFTKVLKIIDLPETEGEFATKEVEVRPLILTFAYLISVLLCIILALLVLYLVTLVLVTIKLVAN